ncbi:MAG: aminotransferase class III-fold pyridoxal phosphate-dependent enzyme [Chloroflexi bacterium]|nr:aminotransferase class III-fold pyridoxal phosphate-dependent enzyme [Chloroflexota bacterium]
MTIDTRATTDHIPAVLPAATPIVVDHALGAELWDEEGRRYLDFTAGIAVCNTGHCHPRVVAAVREQAGKALHVQANIYRHRPMIDLAAALTRLLPPELDQVFFGNSGAEAIEGALKLAKAATRRPAIIAFKGAFHGRTAGAMALTTSKVKVRAHHEPHLPGVYFAPFPNVYRSTTPADPDAVAAACLAELQTVFDTMVHPEDVAAIIVEPVQGEGGYIVAPPAFLRGLRVLCDQHGILLIFDEIQSGFGRTGRLFAFEHSGVRPDILCLAKGIASGLPLSAIVAGAATFGHWAPGAHGSTYGGNPVACAAGRATLAVIEEERLAERAARLGERLMAGLRALQRQHPVIGDVRGLGLMVGVEFVRPDGTPDGVAMKRVQTGCRERGLLLLSAGAYEQVIRWMPPLVATEQQIDEALAIFGAALA